LPLLLYSQLSYMKRHFEILDGLRGTAALLVLFFHLLDGLLPYAANPLRHAYLAVDFFFLLSGFVIGYAYDDRWPGLSLGAFLRARIIRLHPLVLLSVVLGALCYWFDPFVDGAQRVGASRLALMLGCGALLLPTPPSSAPGGWLTHPLNSPGWSLLQEYLANIAYALVAWRLGRRALGAVVALTALALVATALKHGSLDGGWAWHSFWMAPVRVAFPFAAGLLLHRLRVQVRVPSAYSVLSGLLLLVFMAPAFVPAAYYHLFCVLVIFPLIVAVGAGATSAGRLSGLCRISGQLSYPLYLVHFPFTAIFGHWVKATHPPLGQLVGAMAVLIVFLIGLAWMALHFYDEPVRAWLNARARRQRLAPQLQGG
jgi:peptidoglycan/LPS O-acetylase OafA/YrhL